MYGGSGNDTLYGGGKADIMSGGSGNDTYIYKVGLGTENESKVGGADHITDFQTGDIIDVSFMDANGSAAGSPEFTFLNGAEHPGRHLLVRAARRRPARFLQHQRRRRRHGDHLRQRPRVHGVGLPSVMRDHPE